MRVREMTAGDHIIRRGYWLYDGTVPAAVVVTRGDVFYGSGDHEDSPETREDRDAKTFRVWFELPPGSGEFPTCGGQFISTDDAMKAIVKLIPSGVRWE